MLTGGVLQILSTWTGFLFWNKLNQAVNFMMVIDLAVCYPYSLDLFLMFFTYREIGECGLGASLCAQLFDMSLPDSLHKENQSIKSFTVMIRKEYWKRIF